jgi:hypothetical protein
MQTKIKNKNQMTTKEILSSASTTTAMRSASPRITDRSDPIVESRGYRSIHLVEVGLELMKLLIGKTAESERVGTKRNRVASIVAASQDSSKDHASGRHTSNLEATRTSRSETELSTAERLVAHVVVVLRDRVERVGLATLVNTAATDGTTDHTTEELGTGAQNTVSSEAFTVKALLGFDGGGKDHGEGDEGVDGELHFEGDLSVKGLLRVEK